MAADKVSPCANAPTLLSGTVQGICCCALVCLSLHEETGCREPLHDCVLGNCLLSLHIKGLVIHCRDNLIGVCLRFDGL